MNPFIFYNRKYFFSMHLICLVDYKMWFCAVCYGFGSCHGARVPRNSKICNNISDMDREDVFVLGDKAFQGFRNIRITESTRARLISENESYQLRVWPLVIVQLFGLFKGKFERFYVWHTPWRK